MTAVAEAGLSEVLYVSDTRYVAHQQHTTNVEANKQLGLASFLGSNTASAKAVLNADISLGHADTLAAAWRTHPDEFEDIEQQLLDAIPGRDVDSFQKLVRQWEWRLKENGAGDAKSAFDERSLTAHSMLDGSVKGSFHLTAEQAEVLFEVVETIPDPVDGVVPARTLRQRRADALIEALTGETSTNTNGDDKAPESGGGRRIKIDAVIDIQTLAGLIDDHNKEWSIEDLRSELHRSGDLPPAVIAQLMCDASFRRIIFDGPNVVLDYSWATPLIPPALRRAIQIRDRHCVVHGCDRSHLWCDIHHLVERSSGGKTEEPNLGLVEDITRCCTSARSC